MKKIIVLVIVLLSLFIGGIVYVNVTREVPVVCTINNDIADKDEVELYVDGDYVKRYISNLDVEMRSNSDAEKKNQFYAKYADPQKEELKEIYENYGLNYHGNAGEVTWIEAKGNYNYIINFDDESIDVELISGSSILKDIKIESGKVTLKYFVEELEKQGYECDD